MSSWRAESKGRSKAVVLRFDLNVPTLSVHEHASKNQKRVRYTMLSLPLYMVEQSERLLRIAFGD